MNFADAVRGTPEIAGCLKAGIQALGSHRQKVKVNATRSLTGSVDRHVFGKTLSECPALGLRVWL